MCCQSWLLAAAGSMSSLQSTRLHRTLKCYQGQHSRMQVAVGSTKYYQVSIIDVSLAEYANKFQVWKFISCGVKMCRNNLGMFGSMLDVEH